MSLKKRIFHSNMLIIFISLFLLLMVVLGVLVIYEDTFERQVREIKDFHLDELVIQFFRSNIFFTLISAVLIISVITIIVILLLASIFTRKINKIIMLPVDLLVAGTTRVKNGNLEEPIEYTGEEEFEKVCQTFNDMQSMILEDKRQRERYDQARTDMITGISHDLRTPLTSIQGYIKGVLDGVASDEESRRKYLQTAYDSTIEMNKMLQQLFDFSRMETGGIPINKTKVNFVEIIESYVISKQTVQDEKYNIHLDINQNPYVEVNLDTELMHRVLDNLFENSLKYAGVSKVDISVAIELYSNRVCLIWKDNGKGVPEDKLSKIFDRFYRVDESRSIKGSGIGLYVVEYIMKQHQGNARAENEQGLKIILTFPTI